MWIPNYNLLHVINIKPDIYLTDLCVPIVCFLSLNKKRKQNKKKKKEKKRRYIRKNPQKHSGDFVYEYHKYDLNTTDIKGLLYIRKTYVHKYDEIVIDYKK